MLGKLAIGAGAVAWGLSLIAPHTQADVADAVMERAGGISEMQDARLSAQSQAIYLSTGDLEMAQLHTLDPVTGEITAIPVPTAP